MIREAREEAGIEILPEDLALGCVMNRKTPDRTYVDFFFTCLKWENAIENREPDKCSELRFFPIKALPEETLDYVREALFLTQTGQPYAEFGWEKAT